MKQIDKVRKKQLEDELGYEICPLNVEVNERCLRYWHIENVLKYSCAFVSENSENNKLRKISECKPCSQEYAETCPLYKEYKVKNFSFQWYYENFFPMTEDD